MTTHLYPATETPEEREERMKGVRRLASDMGATDGLDPNSPHARMWEEYHARTGPTAIAWLIVSVLVMLGFLAGLGVGVWI